MAMKCTKCCPKRLKIPKTSKSIQLKSTKPSHESVKHLIKTGSKNSSQNSTHNKTHTEADDESNTENEGDCFSNWWDSSCCKCCACFKRGFVAEKSPANKLETEYFIQHTQDLTFLSDMRIQPTDVLRVKNKGRALPSIVPESMKMGLTI